MAEVAQPSRRRSLVAGEARRDRFKHKRAGTGRTTTAREMTLQMSAQKGKKLDDDPVLAFSPAAHVSQYEFDLSLSSADTTRRSRRFSMEDSFSSVNTTATPVKTTTEAFFAPITPGAMSVVSDTSGVSFASSPGSEEEKYGGNSTRLSTASSMLTAEDIADVSIDGSFESMEQDSPPAPRQSKAPKSRRGEQSVKKAPRARKSPRASKQSEESPLSLGMEDFEEGSPMAMSPVPFVEEELSPIPVHSVSRRKVAAPVEKRMAPVEKREVVRKKPAKKAKKAKTSRKMVAVTPREGMRRENRMIPSAYAETETPADRNTNMRRKRYANRTGGIIEEAEDSGLIDQFAEQEEEEADRGDGLRRSRRQRFRPLDWWRNERMIFRRKNTGVGTFLPTMDRKKPIASPTQFDDVFNKKRRMVIQTGEEADAQKGSKKSKKNKKQKSEKRVLALELAEAEADEDRVPLVPTAEVVDPFTNEELVAVVSKSQEMLNMEPLMVPHEGPSVDRSCLPSGGKMFEEDSFSSGVLKLPANSIKHYEMTNQSEVFYVAKSETNALKVKIHKTTLRLSQGDSFTVPPSNLYHLHNTSSTTDVLLYFVLVKDSIVPDS